MRRQSFGFFFIGLAGIVATGVIVGMGGDNFWALANDNPPFGSTPGLTRGPLVFFSFAVLVGLFEICAAGVMFAGAVIVVQRLRGRI